MVSVGLNPVPMVGKVDEPITNRFGMSQLWPYRLTTEVFGSEPMRVPPSWCAPGRPGATRRAPHLLPAHGAADLLHLGLHEFDPLELVRPPPVVGQPRRRQPP